MATYKLYPNSDTANVSIPTTILLVGYYGGADYVNTGVGYISGVVKIKDELFVNTKCYLFEEGSNLLIMEDTTDANGRFMFENIDENILYYVLVKDDEIKWEHRVQSRITPELM